MVKHMGKNEVFKLITKNKNYRKLLITTMITGLTQWGAFIAMLVLIGNITSSGLQLGVLWAVSGLFPIFMSFLLGGIIDRYDTKKVLFISEFLKVPFYLLFILVPFFEGWTAWILFFIIRFVVGLLQSVTTIVRQTIIPEMMPDEDLVTANSLNFTLTSFIRLIGAATGGLVVSFFSLNIFWIITSISFVYAGFAMLNLDIKRKKISSKERNFVKEIKVGLQVAKNNVFVSYVLLFALTGGLIIGSFNLMIERMVNEVYQVPPFGLSVLYIAEGLTSVIIGYWIANNKIMFKKVHNYGYIYILMGLTWALFSLTNNLFTGSLIMIAFAFVGGFVVPFERNVMQIKVNPDLRGRVFGLWNTCSMLSMQVGALLTGIIIQYLGNRFVTPILSILEILLGIVFLFYFLKEKDNNYENKTI